MAKKNIHCCYCEDSVPMSAEQVVPHMLVSHSQSDITKKWLGQIEKARQQAFDDIINWVEREWEEGK